MTTKILRHTTAILLLLAITSACAKAQTAFKAGETLQYSLYYNWKFIWVKAGSATMTITQSSYNNTPTYLSRLLMRSSQKADNYFTLRDTLMSHVTIDNLRPLYYKKNDIEGSSHRKREAWYHYPDNRCRAIQRYTRKDGRVTSKDETRSEQIHDMLSILLNARNYNTSQWKPGKRINFLMTDGNGVKNHTLIYRGTEKIKIRNNGTKYRCLKLSFVEKRNNKEKEVITFYVSDDSNHIPVRLDMNLNFGSAKAFLTDYSGLKSPMKAQY
ncbi:MAG: DUF3108 domain-containing protein [Bacteroidaceae bacterium]